MQIVASTQHELHSPQTELYGGRFVTPFESTIRWDHVREALVSAGHGPIVEPDELDLDRVRRVHDPDYLDFLESAWDRWTSAGHMGEGIPSVFPARRMQQRRPDDIEGQMGYHCFAIETSIVAGTWQAACSSAAVALTAQRMVAAGDDTFALCRPPGHHAAADLYGGYCFLNNAAIAAQAFIDDGCERVAILDVDFHHGNGTQDIFYERPDVLFASIHGDPRDAFPHFLGYADETGSGPGEGFNLNYPLPPTTPYERGSEARDHALGRIQAHKPEALVVSLGVDTFENDPISFFRLKTDDFRDYGSRIGRLDLPTQFVMEGGYAVDEIGLNVVAVLGGYLNCD